MIEGGFIAFRRALGFAFRDELVDFSLGAGLFQGGHRATLPHWRARLKLP